MEALKAYPKADALGREPGRLPISMVDGEVIVAGVFLPTRLDYEIKRVLASRWNGGNGTYGSGGETT